MNYIKITNFNKREINEIIIELKKTSKSFRV